MKTAKGALALLFVPMLLSPLACSKTDTASTTATSAAAAAGGASTTAAGGAAAGGSTVTAKGFKFAPDKITVKAGETVTFKNEDTATHEPTAGTPDAIQDSVFDVTINGGQSGATPALKAGTIPYFCQLHKTMLGVITVT